MSVTKPRADRDRDCQSTGLHAVTSEAVPSSVSVDVVVTGDAADRRGLVEIHEFVARVLERAHTAAMARNNPDEARGIFHAALSFAEEFETHISDFDRFRFLDAATGV
jgi:hypothetical protein